MYLQVCFDDSGNAPNQNVLALGGLLSTSTRWIEFTREWEAALTKKPGAAYVKYQEIVHGRGEFADARGWNDRLRAERLAELVEITTRYAMPVRFFRAMEHKHFLDHIRSVPWLADARMSVINTPYTTLGDNVVSHVVAYLAREGLGDRCDFYFDTSEVSEEFMRGVWPAAQTFPPEIPMELLPKGVRPQLGSLHFEKDEEFLPLQAADLIAGMTRDELLGRAIHPALKPLRDLPRMGILETENDVRDDGRKLRRHLQHLRFRFPNAEVVTYEEQQERDRKAKRALKRKKAKANKKPKPKK